MAKIPEAIAIGIGPQTGGQAAVNTDVSTATELIATVASASGATGILLRNASDISAAFNRVESDGGQSTGSLTRLSGVLAKVDPVVTFTIDLMGNLVTTTTPIAGEYDFAEYFKQILQGCRLVKGTADGTKTEYDFGSVADATTYKTIKIWRGLTSTESWTLVGCTFNLKFSYAGGEKSTVEVEVIADSVIFDEADTWPSNATDDPATAYGNQRLAAPIAASALSTLDGITRAFGTATLSISYAVEEVKDISATGGLVNTQGVRTVQFDAEYFGDTLETEGDYAMLTDDLTQSGAAVPVATFRIGQVSGAGQDPNAILFLLPSLRVTSNAKVDTDASNVVRAISAYAVISGTTGFGAAADEELRISAV